MICSDIICCYKNIKVLVKGLTLNMKNDLNTQNKLIKGKHNYIDDMIIEGYFFINSSLKYIIRVLIRIILAKNSNENPH